MFGNVDPTLLPSDALKRELCQLARDYPAVKKCYGSQPFDNEKPELEFAAYRVLRDGQYILSSAREAPSHHALYPLIALTHPSWQAKAFVGRMPGRARVPFPDLQTWELDAIVLAGFRHVVTLVPESDIADLYDQPTLLKNLRNRLGEGHLLLPIMDYEPATDDAAFESTVEKVEGLLRSGEKVLVHCGAGCGRTGMFVSSVLVKAGMDPIEAMMLYRRTRGCGPESDDQAAYVVRYALRLRR